MNTVRHRHGPAGKSSRAGKESPQYQTAPSLPANTHTRPFNGPFSGTSRVSRYQKGKTNLDFTEARDSEWRWHQLGRMQVCTLLQTDNHASNPPLSFLQAGCPSCCPTNSVKAPKGLPANNGINCNTDPSLSHTKNFHSTQAK